MNALLVVCPHLSHHFEQIFRVTVIAALEHNSCDTSSLRCVTYWSIKFTAARVSSFTK